MFVPDVLKDSPKMRNVFHRSTIFMCQCPRFVENIVEVEHHESVYSSSDVGDL